MKRGSRKKKALDATLSKGVGSLFNLVSFGYGEHWKLAKPEAEMLGESLAECAATLTSKRLKALESLIDKVFPWVGLVGACAVTVYPRYVFTQQVIREQQRVNAISRQTDGGRAPASNNGTGDGHAIAADIARPIGGGESGGGFAPDGSQRSRNVFGEG